MLVTAISQNPSEGSPMKTRAGILQISRCLWLVPARIPGFLVFFLVFFLLGLFGLFGFPGLVAPVRAEAQGVDVSAAASQSFRPSATVTGAPGVEVETNAVQVGLAVRIPLDPRTFFMPGLSYRGQFLDLQGVSSPESIDALHTLEVPLVLIHVVDPHWSVIGSFTPGLAGNFVGLDNHFRFTGAALAAYAFRRDLVLGFGAVVTYGAGQWLPLPALTLDWQIVDGLTLNLVGPILKLVYHVGNSLEVGTAAELEVARWGIDGEAAPTTIDYYAVNLGALAAVRLTGTTWVNLNVGWSPFRRYNIDGGDKAGQYDPAPGIVLRAGLEVRFPGMGSGR